ncbi:uncharacterized protein LOC110773252 [Prunus avium]|uniref:Uncharacterized protein LOC110773252 n=1 Tax=Prunus avium TaxID=42229 RepID=A0A6P5U297_PRUAV|nr:uncharacterized protein LOC110773252 [Prunus avium]
MDVSAMTVFVIICCGTPILVVGLVFLIVCGIVKEAKIKPEDPKFHLHSATVSLIKASAFEFTAKWDVTLVAVNPNHKLTVSYHSLHATILYETSDSDQAKARVLLATKPVAPPPALSTKTETTHRFRIETLSGHLSGDVAKKISEGRGRGGVTFELHMLGWYRYSLYRTELRKLEAACHDSSSGFRQVIGPGHFH